MRYQRSRSNTLSAVSSFFIAAGGQIAIGELPTTRRLETERIQSLSAHEWATAPPTSAAKAPICIRTGSSTG